MTMTFLARATAFAMLLAMVAGNEIECANGDESCSADLVGMLQAKVDIAATTLTAGDKDQCETHDNTDKLCKDGSTCCKDYGCGGFGEGDEWKSHMQCYPCDWKDYGTTYTTDSCRKGAITTLAPTPAPTPAPTSSAKCEEWCDKEAVDDNGKSDCQMSECGGCLFCGAGPTPAPPSPPTPPPPTPPTPPPSSPSWNYKPMQWIPNLSSPFPIQSCAQIKNANGDLLPANVRQTLASEQKTKCIQVFGILIAGTAGADSNAMRYSANIVAQLLDPNCDGTVDNPNVAAKLDKFKNLEAGWINYGTGAASEESTMDGSFGSQIWKSAGVDSEKPPIALEEAFHMVHQNGWAAVYPDFFGYKEWGNEKQSVACRCMREAQCTWYQHPENGGCTDINGKKCYSTEVKDVFKSGAVPGMCSSGTCAEPSCDCLEFFHKVETTWLGNKFNGYERMGAKLTELKGQGLTQRAALEKLLSQSTQCSQLLQHMKEPKVALPKMHIKETYQCGR